MKKKSILLSLLILCALLTGCGKTDNTPLDPSNDWCRLKDGQLVVTLPSPTESDYRWDYTVSDNSPAELVSQETRKGALILTFRATGDGDVSISFTYSKADSLMEIRALQCAASGGLFAEITQNDRMSMNMTLGASDEIGMS